VYLIYCCVIFFIAWHCTRAGPISTHRPAISKSLIRTSITRVIACDEQRVCHCLCSLLTTRALCMCHCYPGASLDRCDRRAQTRHFRDGPGSTVWDSRSPRRRVVVPLVSATMVRCVASCAWYVLCHPASSVIRDGFCRSALQTKSDLPVDARATTPLATSEVSSAVHWLHWSRPCSRSESSRSSSLRFSRYPRCHGWNSSHHNGRGGGWRHSSGSPSVRSRSPAPACDSRARDAQLVRILRSFAYRLSGMIAGSRHRSSAAAGQRRQCRFCSLQ
jgi:hypothetical protein